MKASMVNYLPRRHLAKGCTKQLLDAGLELTPLENGAELNRPDKVKTFFKNSKRLFT